jgi:hypothetical protein
VPFSIYSNFNQDSDQERLLHPVAKGRHQNHLQISSQGKLFFIQPIGRGGYGTVYQATLKQPPYSERCVKVINKRFIKNPEVLKNEINILRLLDHPNIVRLYETYEDENYLYLVEEYSLAY